MRHCHRRGTGVGREGEGLREGGRRREWREGPRDEVRGCFVAKSWETPKERWGIFEGREGDA